MMTLSDFSEKYMRALDDKTISHVLILFVIAALAIIGYAMCFSGFQIVDEFEHLHASWLVSLGKVPYRDFFEHHHPLLWFISAPVVNFFYDKVIIFYVMRTFSFLISCATLFYMYKTIRLWSSKNGALFGLVLYLVNLITIYNFYQFRPDGFMNFTFIFGVYYWFRYLQNNNIKFLILSFLGFALSLLFLQKITLMLLVIEGIFLILLIQKKVKLVPIIIAALPSIGIGLLFGYYLYANGALLDYFNFNYRFNKAMLFYFDRGAFWLPQIMPTIYGLALLTAIYFFNKKNIYYKIVALLYVAEFLMRAFYFSPHPNYYTLLTILTGIILSVWLDVFSGKYKPVLVIIFGLLLFNMDLLLNKVDKTSEKYNSLRYYQMSDYIHRNSAPDDYLMNGYDKNFNIYRYDTSFYWFGLDMLMPIIEREFDIENKLNVNDLVLKYKPKFIWLEDYPDLQALRTYGEQKYIQVFEREMIRELYQETPFENLIVLK